MMPARYLGVDAGTKRIGLALGESETGISSPLKVLTAHPSARENARAILEVADEYAVDGIVVGLPLNMDGTEGPQAKWSKALAEAIRKAVTRVTPEGGAPARAPEGTAGRRLTVYLHDERLTSHAADQQLAERQLTRKGRKARQDAVAAQVLLQSFLQGGGKEQR